MSQDQFWHVHSLARIWVSWDMSDMLQKYAKIRSAIPAILASPVVLPAAAGVLVVALLSLRRGRQPWLEVDHACLHSFFVLEERTFEWQCFRVQSEHNQHLIRTAKLVNDTFSNYFQELPLRYDGAWIAAYWQRRPLRLLQRCLVCQAVCRFFFQLGSMITRHNQCVCVCGVFALVLQGFVEVSIRAGSFSVAMEIDKLLGREDRRRHMRDTHTHTMHKEFEEQPFSSCMAPLRMPSFHSMGVFCAFLSFSCVFVFKKYYIYIYILYIIYCIYVFLLRNTLVFHVHRTRCLRSVPVKRKNSSPIWVRPSWRSSRTWRCLR